MADVTRHFDPADAAKTLPASPSGAALPAALDVPGYAFVRELGRGGMGVVYEARQTDLSRTVALKVLLAGSHADGSDRARFRVEAEAAARVQHPNVVQTYAVGEHGGLPYLAIEYCPGGSLADRLDGTPWPGRAAAALVLPLARAMQAAHDKGVVHRDLKPANVLFAADGTPKVADFGLAKRLDASARTGTGAVLGTPSYMAPEQASGTREIGPPADVYALGAILYELLTGRPPFKAPTPLETVLQVLEREPVPPQLLNAAVDRDLQTVCLKCLEKDPKRRYASAAALADDLQRYLDGAAVSARSYNVLDRLSRALTHSQYDVEFRAQSNLVLAFAAIVFVFQTAIWLLTVVKPQGDRDIFLMLTTFAQLAAMAAAMHRLRPQALAPTTTAERTMWGVWAGFLIGCMLLGVTSRLAATPEVPHDELALYPRFAVLSGAAFLALGGGYWGGCYAIGAAFFAAALAMPFVKPAGPVVFNLLWTGSLVLIGLRLRRMGRG